MSSRQRLVAVICTVLVTMGLTPASPLLTSGASTGDWLPGLRDSRDLTGPVFVTGRLTDAQGRGIAGRIIAVAWPTMDVLAALQDGDEVNTIAVAKASTRPNGEFTLRVDPTVPIAEYMEADGTMNLDLRGMGASGGVLSISRRLDTTAAPAWVAPASDARAPSTSQAVTIGATTALPTSASAPDPGPTDKIFPCPDFVKATYNQVWDSIGEVYTGPHATGDFQYSSGADSTLGVGWSVSGAYGSFSQGGTASVSSTATIDYPTQAANKKTVFRTTFQYKKFELWAHNGFSCQKFGYEVRPTAFQGGVASYTAASAPSASHCSHVLSVPATLTKQTSNAITFSNGLKIGAQIGIDLSTKTGFNTSTKIVFRFTSVGDLCGTNSAWPDAYRVVGK